MQYYTGDSMKVLGEIQDLTVAYKDQHVEGLSLVVILGQRPCLMGRNWLEKIQLQWHEIASVSECTPSMQSLLDRYQDVFSPIPGC